MVSRVLKYQDAIESYLNHLLRDCNLTYEELKNPITIKNLGQLVEMTMKEICSPYEMYRNKLDYPKFVADSLSNRFFYQPPIYNDQELDTIDGTFKILDSHHKHAQRSPEWYRFRWERLTASDLGKAVGDKGEKSRWDLVYQKSMSLEQYIEQRSSMSLSGAAIQHGICFEPVATELYEIKNNLKVLEYGCLPHMYIEFLAASPDGICDSRITNPNYHGRMLEIKCPYSRVITGIPKSEYYMQVQLQLEVCDLEYCDFLECDIRVYSGMTHFLKDSPINGNNMDNVSYCYNSLGNRKGVIYEYYDRETSGTKYKYCPLSYTKNEEVSDWINKTKEEMNGGYQGSFKYWWIEEFNTTLIKRDPGFFANMKTKLNDFWNLVVYYRTNGVEELEYKLGLKTKPINVSSKSSLDSLLLLNDEKEKLNMNYMKMVDIEQEEIKNDLDKLDFIDIDDDNQKLSKPTTQQQQQPQNTPKKYNKNKYSDNIEFLDLDLDIEGKDIKTKEKPKLKSIMVVKPDDEN
jgi:putative phage-type endonuclease